MKIAEFRAGLEDLQSALRKWGAAKQAGEIGSVSAALAEFDDMTLAELARQIKAINAQTRRSKAKKPLNEAAIERHVAALKAATPSSDIFERAIDTVIADKEQLSSAELTEIARRFGGSKPPKTSPKAITDFLRARRLEMRRQEGIGATIDRMLGRF